MAWRETLSSNVYLVDISPAAEWQESAVNVTVSGVSGMVRLFGAWWSPAGAYLAVFGHPEEKKPGVIVWAGASGKFKREKVEGLPSGLEINAAAWVTESELLVAGTRGLSSRAHVYHLGKDSGKWAARVCWVSENALRITSMHVAADHDCVYLGADNGSVAQGRLSADGQPEFVKREHATSGYRSMAVLPWKGDSRQKDFVEGGVCSMAFDEEHELLGITYFDGTVAFWDPILRSYVTDFQLSRTARRPRIVSSSAGAFLCTDGEAGRLFKIVRA